MRVLASIACGGLIAWIGLRRLPRFAMRDNYRGTPTPAALGVVLAPPLVAGALIGGHWLAALAGIVLGAAGLLDDLAGSRRARGLLGHLRALARGHVTTGLVKAVAGGVTGLTASWMLGSRGAWLPADGAVIALGANLVNLLDVRPGRAAKASLGACVLLAPAAPTFGPACVLAALAGALVAFLPVDLGERGMLGDTGANMIGGVLGVVAVGSLGPTGRLATLAALAALTLASEAVSFTRVIESVPPLRALDELGRTKHS